MTEEQKAGIALATALSRFQAKAENIIKEAINPHFGKKYADLASVWDVIREPLTSEGLAIIQEPVVAPPGYVGLKTTIVHINGGSRESEFHMPVARDRDPQAVGSAITYARRYALMGVCGIAPEDDDANAAAPPRKAAKASSPVDAKQAIKEANDRLNGCKTATEARSLYAAIRVSGIEEPHKTQLLSQMATTIRATWPEEVKK